MTNAWQAAEILEAIIRNANPAKVCSRVDDVMWGRSNSEFVAVALYTDEIGGVVEATYEFEEATILKDTNGTLEEVLDWLRTGLQKGQEAWLTARDQDGNRRLALKQTFTDHKMAAALNVLMQKSAEEKFRDCGREWQRSLGNLA
jgi:hypothetical protein